MSPAPASEKREKLTLGQLSDIIRLTRAIHGKFKLHQVHYQLRLRGRNRPQPT